MCTDVCSKSSSISSILELLKDEVLSLSGGECQFDGDWKVVHYDKTIFGFEEGDESENVWAAWSGEPPEVVDHETFCGRRSLYVSTVVSFVGQLTPMKRS